MKSQANRLRLGIAGLGTVAQALLELLRENGARINAQAHATLSVTRVASRTPRPNVDLGGASFSTSLDSLLGDDVDVVVELIGGSDAALSLIQNAATSGKAVVTANKDLLANHGNELFETFARKDVALGFEASVAGGIPIVEALRTGLSGNQIDWLAGIINGTCNFILTAMDQENASFDDALRRAQELGFAEADPSFDVDGIDAAQKLAISTALGMDTPIKWGDVYTEGIRGLSPEDLRYAHELGYAVKHICVARCSGTSVDARVHPALIPHTALLSRVDGVENAVLVGANAVGSLLMVGPGAGGRATASSVVADVVNVARGNCAPINLPRTDKPYLKIDSIQCQYYLYIPAADQPGIFASIAEVLGASNVSIESVIQKQEEIRHTNEVAWVPIVIVTNTVSEASIDRVIDELQSLDEVRGKVRKIRIVDFA